ncbi:hypothetical protein [Anaerospora hongkongensis]|uniref:hypothetical protein n=1 Tax=Anaerospora hongkongensis TaxID=244830 RepID=UPI002FD9ABF2
MKLPKIPAGTVQEITVLAGFFMVAYGLYSIYPPVMWILCGVWLMIPAKKGR